LGHNSILKIAQKKGDKISQGKRDLCGLDLPPTKNVNYIMDYRLGRHIDLFPIHGCEYTHPLAKIYLYTYDVEYYWLTYVYAFGIYNVQ
jgi:hypothetical protein